jgi:hypothetical protein
MKRPGLTTPTDRVGEVFRVVDHEIRRCLIWEECFSREGSRQHSDVCHPHTELPFSRFHAQASRSI